MNVLIINGHPGKNSLSAAFMDAYAAGAGSAGARVEKLMLFDLSFDPNVTHITPYQQWLEPDIKNAQQLFLLAQPIQR